LLFSFKKDETYKGFNLKMVEKSLMPIPSGSFSYSSKADDLPVDSDLQARTEIVASFFMCQHEVSNEEYREFIIDLRKNGVPDFKQMLPDTMVWHDKEYGFNDPYIELYYQHPAYRSYPVVGITHEQAEYYCKWFTERYRKEINRKYKKAVFKLPSAVQWTYAAKGGLDFATFPWGAEYMQNYKGDWLANFSIVPQHTIVRERSVVKNKAGKFDVKRYGSSVTFLNYGGDLTAPVISYFPNDYGLYNMSGNVEEYVSETGFTKGGGWKDTGYYLVLHITQKYDATNYVSSDRGFRVMMEIEK
jgi:sulfatase modifying factor 1